MAHVLKNRPNVPTLPLKESSVQKCKLSLLNIRYMKLPSQNGSPMFTLVRFTQYDSSFHYISNSFASLKHNNLLSKMDRCECGFTLRQSVRIWVRLYDYLYVYLVYMPVFVIVCLLAYCLYVTMFAFLFTFSFLESTYLHVLIMHSLFPRSYKQLIIARPGVELGTTTKTHCTPANLPFYP